MWNSSSSSLSPQCARTPCAKTGVASCLILLTHVLWTSKRFGSKRHRRKCLGEFHEGESLSSGNGRELFFLSVYSMEVILRAEAVEMVQAGDKCDFIGTLIVVPDVSQLRTEGAQGSTFRCAM